MKLNPQKSHNIYGGGWISDFLREVSILNYFIKVYVIFVINMTNLFSLK